MFTFDERVLSRVYRSLTHLTSQIVGHVLLIDACFPFKHIMSINLSIIDSTVCLRANPQSLFGTAHDSGKSSGHCLL